MGESRTKRDARVDCRIGGGTREAEERWREMVLTLRTVERTYSELHMISAGGGAASRILCFGDVMNRVRDGEGAGSWNGETFLRAPFVDKRH